MRKGTFLLHYWKYSDIVKYDQVGESEGDCDKDGDYY
jgi:hypothetical protein